MDLFLENIGHSYGETEVLQDISLSVPAGKILCIVGPSGCGKSTLLRLIGGLERPVSGQVIQLGTPPADCINPLTYVFQDFALLPWFSVEKNISVVLEDHNINKARRTVVHFDQSAEDLAGRVDIGTISIACGLAVIDYTCPDVDWRGEAPNLATWYDDFSQRPSLAPL